MKLDTQKTIRRRSQAVFNLRERCLFRYGLAAGRGTEAEWLPRRPSHHPLHVSFLYSFYTQPFTIFFPLSTLPYCTLLFLSSCYSSFPLLPASRLPSIYLFSPDLLLPMSTSLLSFKNPSRLYGIHYPYDLSFFLSTSFSIPFIFFTDLFLPLFASFLSFPIHQKHFRFFAVH